MAQIHTHYDNLKVARNAPSEIIRAAYKALSQKFHPDRNPGNSETTRIMAIINTSYEVLSDPDRRREHDQWVAQQELMIAQATNANSQPQPAPRPASASAPPPNVRDDLVVRENINSRIFGLILMLIGGIPIIVFIGGAFYSQEIHQLSTTPSGPKPYQVTPAPVQPEYVSPSKAPNDQPWPVSAGYVNGYQRLHAEGLSTVTVDNSRNDSDVFVKLVSLDSAQPYPVRQFYIPAFGSFTLDKVTAGSYDIRYRDLGNGGLSRSEAFNLEEIPTYNGMQFSNITMTVYKVQNGKMQTYALSEAEF